MVAKNIVDDAIERIPKFKGMSVDMDARTIIAPLPKGITESEMLCEGMLGKYFMDNGFDVSFETRDVEYTTKGKWANYRGNNFKEGHKAWLRNRLCMILKWE